VRKFLKPSKNNSLAWQTAPDVKRRLKFIAKNLSLTWIKTSRIFVYRSRNSSSRAYARTWGFPRIWQISLKEDPAYVIEVLTERFDKLSLQQQDRVLIHELMHIPKNFSGTLLPHIRKGKNNFYRKVETLVERYLRLKK
jgi:predicted metallopeptidase